jgi:cell division protease FtsH
MSVRMMRATVMAASWALAHALVASHPSLVLPATTRAARPPCVLPFMSVGPRLRAAGAALAAAAAAAPLSAAEPKSTPWAYSTFLEAVDNGMVEKVSFAADGKQVLSIDKDGNRHETLIPPSQSADLIKMLVKKNVVFAVQGPEQQSAGGAIGGVLANLAFPLLIIGGLIFLQRRSGGMGGGGGGDGNPFTIGKSKSKVQMEPETGVGFSDVAGCDASKQELAEVVEFLKVRGVRNQDPDPP